MTTTILCYLDFQRQRFLLSDGSRIQPLGLFSSLVSNPTSLLLYNKSIGYRSSFESCSKLLQLCTTFSINVFRRTLRTLLHFTSMTPNIVNCGRHPPDLPLSIRQEYSLGDMLSRSAGRMFGSLPATIRLINNHAAFRRALKTSFSTAFAS